MLRWWLQCTRDIADCERNPPRPFILKFDQTNYPASKKSQANELVHYVHYVELGTRKTRKKIKFGKRKNIYNRKSPEDQINMDFQRERGQLIRVSQQGTEWRGTFFLSLLRISYIALFSLSSLSPPPPFSPAWAHSNTGVHTIELYTA